MKKRKNVRQKKSKRLRKKEIPKEIRLAYWESKMMDLELMKRIKNG